MIVSGSLPRDKFARMLKNSQAITSTKELEEDWRPKAKILKRELI
jgi:hypothetical protein